MTQTGSAPVRRLSRTSGGAGGWGSAQRLIPGLGLVPFALYVLIFLLIPTVLALTTGFFNRSGAFTWDNIAALVDPTVLKTFGNSLWISLLTAALGALVGAIVCYALLSFSPTSRLRASVEAVSSVLAQFGGVMLAFAFIATIGVQGLLTVLLKDVFGVALYPGEIWLYQMPGLILPYLYFQIPLMVLTFMPALSGLKPAWTEANATLGGSSWTFWRRVGIPVLAPAFAGGFLLLFANSFSAYATAAALISQGSQIVPLQIRTALISETVLGRENLAGALALGMIVIMIVLMLAYSALQARTARWQK
ncbi:ABC transporter permease subunit [Mycetocola tolaasinivorans]|uniref:ABC transporter permease subunit n=1 Tax=Mycetocola tolaasinivorans TaxID=76635 RepID=A0A3L7A5Z1_9MICO|nr:ABC transporter permease subunit [Mycetocola tolaasinivorans]RLP75746.1 ABC transporter permease subunit [Mycetocola tolaasinivorans]